MWREGGSFASHCWSISSLQQDQEEENLRHDLLVMFHKEEELEKERENIGERSARKMLGDESFTNNSLLGFSQGGDLQLTNTGRNFLEQWPLLMLQGPSKRMQAIIP
jgi:hypothetical protein